LSVSPELVEKIAQAVAESFASALRQQAKPASEWEVVEEPFEKPVEEEPSKLVLKADSAPEALKELKPLRTGTILDELFLSIDGSLLGGIPLCGQFIITGLPGSGKSILVEEIAVRTAYEGVKVLFVTSEDQWKARTERFDLQSRMAIKAEILRLNWEKIAGNLYILDAATYPELREWESFVKAYRYAIEQYKIELVIVDSLTLLEAYRGALKYRLAELMRYNQNAGVTAIFINQRSAERWDSYDIAGGIGLAHLADGTIIVDYGRVYYEDQMHDLNAKRGEFVRIVRVLDCRLTGFRRERIRVEITDDGFLRKVDKHEPS